ncbi:hypothetical protein TL16_g06498 [Triparma laevis f. inornata]|uniref:START domain-containing protein n=1 Tax=Triparma laevis f. inornata TaxID=1714386 RepID=A0A9W7ALP3_9STRA|nr:hypothetical protein TL16_g06498 [Triparma laevis f. inornata]
MTTYFLQAPLNLISQEKSTNRVAHPSSQLSAALKLISQKDSAIALLSAQLDAERQHRQRLELVISEINTDEALKTKRRHLDRDDDDVIENNDVLMKNVTTNNCQFTAKIHIEPKALLKALTEDQTKDSKLLFQKVVVDEADSGKIVYWSYMVSSTKSCDLLLRLGKVEDDNANEIRFKVTSVNETELENLDPRLLPKSHPTTTKRFWLLLNDGMIILKPLPFSQTSFTFSAQDVKLLEVNQDEAKVLGKQAVKIGFGQKADKLFSNLAELMYERFKSEGIIDAKYTQNFIESIPNAPDLIVGEQTVIADSMKLIKDISTSAKRIAGTVNDPVEKFIQRSENGGAVWGLTVARMDVAAVRLFAQLWLVDTYAKKSKNKKNNVAIHEVWNNLDGTRGLQYTRSVSLPGGFQDRVFEAWITWERSIGFDGLATFIVAFTPLEKYSGTHHKAAGSEKMQMATTRGVYVVKELTENTCEWTRAQQVDLKISLPANVLNFVATQEMAWANKIQDTFRRNGKEVDVERIAAVAERMKARRGKPPMEDQLEIFSVCEELLKDDLEWKHVDASAYPDVEMDMRYFEPKKGERSIVTGKGVGIADCSVEVACSWLMDFCSNEGVRVSKEEGNPARLELRDKARENEATFATVKKMPIFLNNREFVARQVWKSEHGKVLVVFASTDDIVDYGVKLKKTRGSNMGLWQAEDLPPRGVVPQCRITYIQRIDAGGNVPTWVVNRKVATALSSVQWAIDDFKQGEKVDAADRAELADYIRESGRREVYSEEEEGLIKRIRLKFEGSLKERKVGKGWKQLKSPDVFVKMEATVDPDGSTAGIGRAVTVVDATIEDCVAWDISRVTRERMKDHYAFGGLGRTIAKLNNHSELYHNTIDFGVRSFVPREWLTMCIWKVLDENTIIVCVEDTEDDNFPIGAGKNYVRATSAAFWRYERLPMFDGVPQTRVTWCQQLNLNGFIPKFVTNSRVVQTLEYLSTMRKKFDRSLEIDAGRGGRIVKKIKLEEVAGGSEASAQFEALFEERQGWERPSRTFGLADSMMQADLGIGSAWDGEGFKKMVKRCQQLENNVDSLYSFTSEMTLQRCADDKVIILFCPSGKDDGAGTRRNSMLGTLFRSQGGVAKETVAIRLRAFGVGSTKLDYACTMIGHGGGLGFVERRLEEIADISVYFQRLVPLMEYTAEDGVALGYDLLWKIGSSKERVERFLIVLKESHALRELEGALPWIKAMMVTALEGSLNLSMAVRTKMVCVSEKEAAQIGKNLIPCLKARKLVQAGIDQWRVQNRAVKDLMEEQVWSEPMSVVLGKGIVKTAAWGLMWRVSLGAVLSVSDLATDLVVLNQFWEGGEIMASFFNAQLASLTASILIQLVFVIFQHRKKGVVRILKEWFIVLVGMKAPWDAYKVAMGAEQEKDTELDPMMEMTYSKGIEIFAESIPGIIIQTSAIISAMNNGENVSTTACGSLVISLLTTGLVSATLSYDWDTDPKNRASFPEFYGFVPDSPQIRAVIFLTLISISAFQVLLKSVLVVCLGSFSVRYAWIYLGGDLGFYLLFKIARGDFMYWAPAGGILGMLISVIARVIVKIVTDYAGVVQFRHPYELGGLYYTLNLFMPLVGLALVLTFMGEGTFNEATTRFIRDLAFVLGGCLLFSVGLLLSLIDEKYRATFLSTETGVGLTRRIFVEGKDFMKVWTFSTHKIHWWPIRDKMQEWVSEGWERWEEEKPEFFTDAFRECVEGMGMVPKKFVVVIDSEGEGGEEVERVAVVKAEVKAESEMMNSPTGLRTMIGRSLSSRVVNLMVEAKVAPEGVAAEFDEGAFIRKMKSGKFELNM